ncbi:MAG: hypothetical protein KA099_00650 [Alphaproteobacteria bacterium]|nr:hypothetical protein [Alphaproteobacteria bacterium]MBP7758111.1 hypothetical protein [Alphaproteobacteria bacterium]MBP7761456.1 hypothetical protein [Alphaproteobacteria bacterium]MBP7903809.1 hypothetical protein [Alphaproteobacteria bacterium]
MSTDNKTEIIEKQKMEENVIHNIKILVENDVQQKPQEKNGINWSEIVEKSIITPLIKGIVTIILILVALKLVSSTNTEEAKTKHEKYTKDYILTNYSDIIKDCEPNKSCDSDPEFKYTIDDKNAGKRVEEVKEILKSRKEGTSDLGIYCDEGYFIIPQYTCPTVIQDAEVIGTTPNTKADLRLLKDHPEILSDSITCRYGIPYPDTPDKVVKISIKTAEINEKKMMGMCVSRYYFRQKGLYDLFYGGASKAG